jgi:hypothetical protein
LKLFFRSLHSLLQRQDVRDGPKRNDTRRVDLKGHNLISNPSWIGEIDYRLMRPVVMGLDVLKIRAFLESGDVPVELLQPAIQIRRSLINTPERYLV